MELDELLSEAESEESKGTKWKTQKNQIPTFGIQTILTRKLCLQHCKVSYDKCHQILQIL